MDLLQTLPVYITQVSQRHTDAFCQQLTYSKANMHFVKGHIEYLDKAGIADESIDVIISNCVVNLSPDKKRVLEEAYRVLVKGGEFYFSDVYSDRRLPQDVKDNEVLLHADCATYHKQLVQASLVVAVSTCSQHVQVCQLQPFISV